MNRLTIFFRNADTQFGVFYPKHYLLAAFPNLADAQRAQAELTHGGRLNEDVLAVSGEEVIRFAEYHRIKDGLWGALMTPLSRIFGTEALYAERDLAAAQKGAAFLAVRCPTEKVKVAAWKLLAPTHPLVARYYHFGGIEHLVGEN